jgi:uncharacterized Fe-S cluster protein YjdI
MSQKPHADSEESAISHARAYSTPGATVYYDSGRCLHFAECIRGLPEVFDVQKRPWIQPQNASAEEVAEVVRRCPSLLEGIYCNLYCNRADTHWYTMDKVRPPYHRKPHK